jgi:hypothetical protein
MYGLGPILPACRIEIEDGDDLPRSRLLDQIPVMEAPGSGGINSRSNLGTPGHGRGHTSRMRTSSTSAAEALHRITGR